MIKYVTKKLKVPIPCCDICEREIEGEPPVKIKLETCYCEHKWFDFGEWVFCSIDCLRRFREDPRWKNLVAMVEYEQKVADVRFTISIENPKSEILKSLLREEKDGSERQAD